MNSTPDLNVISAIQDFQNGNLENAANLLNRALLCNPNNFDALLMLGVINGIVGLRPQALNCLERAAKIEPKNNLVHFNLAKVYSELGDELSSIRHHKIATTLAPNHPEAWLNYGRSQFRLRNYLEASECFQEALKINAQFAEAIASLASTCIFLNESVKAMSLFDEAIDLNPSIPGAWLMKADGLHELKRFEEAITHYDQALKLKPDYAEAWSNKGISLHELKRFEEAITHYDQALKLKPDYAEAWSNKGISLHELKRFEEAITHYDQALKLKPDYAEAWSNKGISLHELKRFEEAITHYDQALKLKPDYAEAWSNKGISLHELKRFEEAITHYDQALKLKPDYAEAWSNKGISLHELKRFEEAITHYDQALKLKPDYAQAWSNKGFSLILADAASAIECLQKAIQINPDYSEAYCNLGLAFSQLKNYSEALKCFDIAISLTPNFAKAWANKGMVLNELNKLPEALNCFEMAYSKNSNLKFLLGNIINNKLFLALWNDITPLTNLLVRNIGSKIAACAPFQILSLTDDSKVIKNNSHSWAKDVFKPREPLTLRSEKNDKIRIGYFSPDFKTHPVGILLAGVIESHDRSKFEILGFSCGKIINEDPYTKRFKDSFDQFFDINNLNDEEIATIANYHKIDIAVDLGGYTKDSVTSAFSLNLAPIQVNYLGYIGTIGWNAHDYIIADRVAIPISHEHFYSEKLVHLPNSFLPDDDTRKPSASAPSRIEFELPERDFVFACFNNGYKLNPEHLNLWATILQKVPHGVLWLPHSNNTFVANLVMEFESRGIDRSRIIFAKRMDNLSDHLARLSLADLFLDTFPYNAHATAVDALRSGLPLITMPGDSMASRVGASLLTSLQLDELIANDRDDYITKAINFANNPNALRRIKEKLMANIHSSNTFNTDVYTRNLEDAYITMHNRRLAGLPPTHILNSNN